VDEKQKQSILDLPKVIAVGISSPVATILTSRFGVAGTLIGLALSAVILTVLADILKVYLARAPGTVAKMPGGFRTRLSWRKIRGRIGAAFDYFWSLSPARRRSILVGSVVAGVISFFVGLSVVTGLELSAGKSISCWVWNECPAESSADGEGEYSSVSTRPSIFGGGRAVSSSTPQTEPFGSEQQSTPDASGSPSQPSKESPSSETPSSRASERQRSPSGGSEDRQPEDRQPEDRQWSSSDSSDSEDRQPEDRQWRPSNSSEEDQQPEDRQSEDQQQKSSSADSEDQQSQEDQQPKNRELKDRQESSSADSDDQQSTPTSRHSSLWFPKV
jgi:hypothetical protein